MAIREFSPEGARAKIAFVGVMPTKKYLDRFRERGFQCVRSTVAALVDPAFVAQLDAVIWTQDPQKPNALPRNLGSTVPCLLDYDVRVYIRIAEDKFQSDTSRRLVVNALIENNIPVSNIYPAEWQKIRQSLRERQNAFLMPYVYILDSALSWFNIAALVCDHPAGPSPKSGPKFAEEDLLNRFGQSGHEERVLLIKRAFWNCSKIQLMPMGGGLSGAPVFKAYASLDAGLVQAGEKGAYPHLYFVKIGPRKKIIDEYDQYCGYIFEYVPFYLGPRLRRDRCNLGSTQGILVGDFVDGAEPLMACAQAGRSGHAIANLFEKTLGGWRKQYHIDNERSLSSSLEKKWYVDGHGHLIELPAERVEILGGLNISCEINPLKSIFEKLGKSNIYSSPAHGDMHPLNVLVRHGDAIIIDFEKLEHNYPLTYDPASLEAGLLVEGFTKDLKSGDLTFKEILALISPLYEYSALTSGPATLCMPSDAAAWFYDAVNQIRTLSWPAEREPGQYALTLALCLIKKGCNQHAELKKAEPNTLRAIAFFFGQKILRTLESDSMTSSAEPKPREGDIGL